MYLRPPCYGNAMNCHLVYLAIPGTRPLCMKKQNVFVLIYTKPQKNEIQICSNKHETGLVYPPDDYEQFFSLSNICLVCIKETSQRDVSFTYIKHKFIQILSKIIHK